MINNLTPKKSKPSGAVKIWKYLFFALDWFFRTYEQYRGPGSTRIHNIVAFHVRTRYNLIRIRMLPILRNIVLPH